MNQGPEGIGNDPSSDPPAGLDWDLWLGPGPDAAVQPAAGRQQPTTTARSWTTAAAGRPAWPRTSSTCPSGPWIWAIPTVTQLLGRAVRDRRRRRRPRHAGGPLAVSRHDHDLDDDRWSTASGSTSAAASRRGGWGSTSTASTARCTANYGMHEIVPEGDRMKDAEPPEQSIPPSPGHEREWLDCDQVAASSRAATSTTTTRSTWRSMLANLSYKLGRSIRFDPEDREDRRRRRGGPAGPPRVPRPVEVPGRVPGCLIAPRRFSAVHRQGDNPMSESNELSRRKFTAEDGRRRGGGRTSSRPRRAGPAASENPAQRKIRVGLIGAGGMGRGNLKNCTKYDDVVVTGICEVWKERRDATIAELRGKAQALQRLSRVAPAERRRRGDHRLASPLARL